MCWADIDSFINSYHDNNNNISGEQQPTKGSLLRDLIRGLFPDGRRQPAGEENAQKLNECDSDADADQRLGVVVHLILELHDAALLEVSVLEQGVGQVAVVSFRVHVLGSAATRAQSSIFALVHPIGRSFDAAALQLALHIVPGHQVIGVGLLNRRLQLVLQSHLQVRLEADRSNPDGQFHYEDNCQAHGELCGWRRRMRRRVHVVNSVESIEQTDQMC